MPGLFLGRRIPILGANRVLEIYGEVPTRLEAALENTVASPGKAWLSREGATRRRLGWCRQGIRAREDALLRARTANWRQRSVHEKRLGRRGGPWNDGAARSTTEGWGATSRKRPCQPAVPTTGIAFEDRWNDGEADSDTPLHLRQPGQTDRRRWRGYRHRARLPDGRSWAAWAWEAFGSRGTGCLDATRATDARMHGGPAGSFGRHPQPILRRGFP